MAGLRWTGMVLWWDLPRVHLHSEWRVVGWALYVYIHKGSMSC